MTVKDMITKLQQFDPAERVRVEFPVYNNKGQTVDTNTLPTFDIEWRAGHRDRVAIVLCDAE